MDVAMNSFYAILGGAGGGKFGQSTGAFDDAGKLIGTRIIVGEGGKVMDFKGNILETTSAVKNHNGENIGFEVTKYNNGKANGKYIQQEVDGKTQTIEYDANNKKISESNTEQGVGTNYKTTTINYKEDGSEKSTVVTERKGNTITVISTSPKGEKPFWQIQ